MPLPWALFLIASVGPLTWAAPANENATAEITEDGAGAESPPRIVEVEPSHVVISVGREDGVSIGDSIELYHEEVVDLGLDETTTRHVTDAVGTVVDVARGRSRVDIGLRETVDPEGRAQSTVESPTATPLFPKRVGRLWTLSMTARPFLAWSARGAGSLVDAALSYRFRKSAAIHVIAEPVGFGVADQAQQLLVAGTAHGLVSWDTQYFEFGAGLGWSIVRGNFNNNAFAIPQLVRVGAIDGLNLRVFNQFVLLFDKWAWGGTNARVQIPVWTMKERWWIELTGGGGIAGYGFGEAGVRFLLWGNGGPNSFYLRGAAGFAQLTGDDGRNDVEPAEVPQFSHRGPMASFGFEWRPGRRGSVGRSGAADYGAEHDYGYRPGLEER